MPAPKPKAAAPAAAPKVIETPKYRMPKPPRGIVLWFPSVGSEPTPAIVTRDGSQAISVTIFPSEHRGGIPKDSVLHVSDPRVARGVPSEFGIWDYTDEHKLLAAIAQIAIPDADGSTHLLTDLAKKLRPEFPTGLTTNQSATSDAD